MTETSRSPAPESDPGVLDRTAAALSIAAHRWDSRLVFVGSGLLYLLVYLFTVGDLSLVGGGPGEFSVRVANDLSRAFAGIGFFRFDAIAVVSAGPITYLFSPLNLLVSLALAVLVAANFALAYLGLVQPKACGLESSTGILAGIPALLSGAACCGPTILLLIGLQASATMITAFQLLVPVAFVLLVAGLLLVGRQVNPELL
jgi:hypothetical protein